MRSKGANGVGRFSVELEVANYGDLTLTQRGLMPPDEVRRETIQGVVDSGATKLVLPEDVVKRLGLPLGDPVNVRYADGRKARARGQGSFRPAPGTRWRVHGHQRTETRDGPGWSDRARRPRPPGRLRSPAGRSPRPERRDLRDRVNARFQGPEDVPRLPCKKSTTR